MPRVSWFKIEDENQRTGEQKYWSRFTLCHAPSSKLVIHSKRTRRLSISKEYKKNSGDSLGYTSRYSMSGGRMTD